MTSQSGQVESGLEQDAANRARTKDAQDVLKGFHSAAQERTHHGLGRWGSNGGAWSRSKVWRNGCWDIDSRLMS